MSGRGPDRRAVLASLAIHGLVLVPVVVFARPPAPIEFETIRINLVSPPPAEVVAPEEAVVESRPDPEPEPERPEPEPADEPEPEPEPPPEPEPEPEPERVEIEQPPERAATTPPEETEPEPEAERGGEGLNVVTEGREFPYPDYLANVITEVNRYFRWSDPSRPKAVIYFEITGDGRVRNMRMVRPSGNIRFDFAVQGAVETAGNRGAFGPLPEGFAAPFLPVQLEMEPPQ